ncbi:hypothetical protein GW17_00020204 [Ensete ventricosum]|nr:hypothetical protein GW17_00020204 [Ensete ventricosum]
MRETFGLPTQGEKSPAGGEGGDGLWATRAWRGRVGEGARASGRSTYQPAAGPICTGWYGPYRSILLFTTLLVVTSWIGIVEGWRHRIGIEKRMEISSRGGSPDSPSSSNALSFLLRCFSLSLAIARLESFVNNVWYIKILSPEDVLKMGKVGVESLC